MHKQSAKKSTGQKFAITDYLLARARGYRGNPPRPDGGNTPDGPHGNRDAAGKMPGIKNWAGSSLASRD